VPPPLPFAKVRRLSPRSKNLLFFGVKLLVAGLLLGWLIRAGNLDFRALRIFVDRPILLALDVGVFGFGALVCVARFRALLGIAGVKVGFGPLFRLQMTAFFFNVVIPGNIGGDLLKALYVARDEPPEKRTTILVLAFVERLLGLAALVLLGALVVLVRSGTLFTDPLLRPLAATVAILGVLTLAGGIGAIVLVRVAGARLDAFTTGPTKLSKLLNQLVAALRIISAGPKNIAVALFLSMLYHAVSVVFFALLTRAILQTDVPFTNIATVFPLGLLSLLLPISPSGLGVGHVAFARLFSAIGLASGATVFNVYLLGQIAPGLLGIFPFLSLRKRGELPPGT